MHLFLLLLAACSGSDTKDDTGAVDTSVTDTDTDTDTDADTDTDTDADTDTDPGTGTVTGAVVDVNGEPVVGVAVQFCITVCYSDQTDATGAFEFTEMYGGGYKLEALGPTVATNLGWIRVHVDLEAGGTYALPAPITLSPVAGPASLASGTANFGGGLKLMASSGDVTVPFGYDEDQYYGGLVAPEAIPPMWGISPVGAINLLPVGSTVEGPIGVSAPFATDGTFDVYSVDEHGELEGPVGTATASGGTLTATGLTPTILSLLMFVPQ